MLQNNILHVRLRIHCRKKIHEGQDKSLRIGQSPPMMSRTLSGIIRELAQLSKICLQPCPNYLHDETINCRNGVGDPIKLLHDANFGLQNDFCKERTRRKMYCLASHAVPVRQISPKSRLLSIKAFVQIKAASHACTTPHKTVQFVR